MFSSDDKSVVENIMDFLFKGENSFALFTSNICSGIMDEKTGWKRFVMCSRKKTGGRDMELIKGLSLQEQLHILADAAK